MKRLTLLALCLGFVACRVHSQPPAQNAPKAALPVQLSVEQGVASLGTEPESAPLPSQATLVETATETQPEAADGGAPLAPVVDPVYTFQQVDVLKRPVAHDAAARRNANLSPALCARELRTKKYPFKRVGALKGVATPVRVDGEIEGVRFRVPGNKSHFGVLDCRLALALVDLARFLKAASVTQVTVDNFYRPNARLPSKRSKRSQHAYGMAIDLTSLTLADGRVLHVENDWGAGIDTEPCGAQAWLFTPKSNTVELRELVCALAAQQIFHHHLTPSYDLAHRNHLHLDIKRDEPAVTVR